MSKEKKSAELKSKKNAANTEKTAVPGAIRIQKFLSLAGVASRRHAEEMIAQGRVKVSGRVVTEMGVHVIPGKSRVEVDNKPVFYSEERNYVLFHKPAECITTLDDPEHRTTVIDLLPKNMPRLFPVGRLDWDTEGLLLLTNDGELAYRLTHPAAKVPRVYHAKVRGELKDNSPELKKLQDGVELEDGFAKPDRVSIIKFTGNNTWLEIELHIGRNRIVRRLCDAVGFPVMKLRRVAFGNLTLDGLALGAFRDLTEAEVVDLYEQVGELGAVPTVRSKAGIRYARGFDPKERTMPRQVAPRREDLERKDEEKSIRVNKRPRPSKMREETLREEKPRRAERPRPESPRFTPDAGRSFNSTWDDKGRDERKSFPRDDRRDERKSFPRDDRRDERKSFPRDDRRDERKSFPRGERDERKSFPRGERDERKSFPRGERDERKSFPRGERDERKSFPRGDRDERKSFPRDDRRDDRKSFPRGERDERKSFPRGERDDRKSFPRGERDERKSFPRGDRDERKSFPRGERDERKSFPRGERDERKSFPRGERDERKSFPRESGSGDKKRPFARGVKPRSGSRSSR